METVKISANNQQSSGFSAEEWLSHQAIAKHKAGKLEEAIAFYLEIVVADSNQPCSLYLNLISLMIKVNMLDQGIEVGQKALTVHANSDELHRNLGMMLGKKQNFERSINHYQTSLQIEPLQPEWVFINLAKTLSKISQLNQALEVCKAGLEFYPKSDYLRTIQLNVLVKQNNWQQIPAIFTQNNQDSDNFIRIEPKTTFLLNEYTVYLQCSFNVDWNLSVLEAIIESNNDNNYKLHCFINEENSVSFVIIFDHAIDFKSLQLLLISDQKCAYLKVKLTNKSSGLELIDYINAQPDDTRLSLKENIIHSIIKYTPEQQLTSSQALVNKLESFVKITPKLCNDICEPFSIYFDAIIPIKGEGLFLNGWMSDPFDMLEEINAVSSVGFILPFKDKIHYVDRPDINKVIKKTPYKGIKKQLGIVAYIPFPEVVKSKFEPYAQQSNFRFLIKLKGNVEKKIIPPTSHYSGYSGMNHLLNIFAANKVDTSLFKQCIAPATLALGKAGSRESTEIQIKNIGKPIVENPIASIIIPINKNFDQFKVQFAIMANDASVRKSELIYILSSAEQQNHWEKILENYSYLYDLPVKLISTKSGNDYGTLTNIGVAEAKSDHYISMLPNVLPKTQNWVSVMVDFYRNIENIGALTPKLIYEDLSIQHAGMSFTKDHGDSWNYQHFYQGLSSNYSLAQKSCPVPAVNGVCMMFSRHVHQQVHGLSTDYLVPESEASDFCLKNLELGYKSWYFSKVEMYYFEKQSYFTDAINRYNLESQSKKWHDLLSNLNDDLL